MGRTLFSWPRGIAAKLVAIVGFMALALAVVGGIGLHSLRDLMFSDRVDKIRAIVEVAHDMANSFERDVRSGKLPKEEAIARFRDRVRAMRYDGGKEYVFVYDMRGYAVVAADPAQDGTDRSGTRDPNGVYIVKEFIRLVQSAGEGRVDYAFPRPGQTAPLPKISYVRGFEPWGFIIGTGVYVDDIDARFRQELTSLGLVIGGILLVSLLVAWATARSFTRPLAELETQMEALATGDLAVDIPGTARRDEIGRMARAVAVFKTNSQEMRRLEAEHAAAQERAEQDRRAAVVALADQFEASIKGVVEMVASAATEMQQAASTMSATAEQTSQQARAVTAASEQASGNVQTVAAATEELTSSIGEISRQVTTSTRISAQAVEEAMRTTTTIDGLVEAAQQIGEVVQLINDIASQTNLLALNATIEAARAGEAGKGFAVVASEVKSLAAQTGRATEEIQAKVQEIQAATTGAQQAIESIGRTIGQVNEIATTIASAVEQQNAATADIAANVQQAATGTTEVSTNITGVNQAASETGAAASQVLGAASSLSREAEHLRSEVATFIARVRAS
ncbi:cache domain-containing protein [Azospirillum thermophilum]|uniref:Chemotaxis protein n=1 Tax=Azospirillum thermophilum TaxID=2202148 RepID=A0A2S2CXY9_9PROT|nr:cache domain-containing protein [Azospirillum thermophilum]AWK89339.1 chemotaxis protein [Azospirillum thermophilum]